MYWFSSYADNLADYYYYRIENQPENPPKLDINSFVAGYDDWAFIEKFNLSCFDENSDLTSVPLLFVGDYSRIQH